MLSHPYRVESRTDRDGRRVWAVVRDTADGPVTVAAYYNEGHARRLKFRLAASAPWEAQQ